MHECLERDSHELPIFYSHTIVEETLTSGKYVSLFLISILYIYIKFKKIRDNPRIF